MKLDPPIKLPRPNLGPEPWPESRVWPWLVAVGVITALTGLLMVRLRRQRKTKAAEVIPKAEISVDPEPANLSDPVREALVRAFGPSWRARTTEEVAASRALVERFGAEVSDQIAAYLRAVDRAKFSGDSSAPPADLGWWAARFVEEVEAGPSSVAAGAISRITGK